MDQIPSSLVWKYRLATDRDICSWSYGVLTTPRKETQSWSEQRGTLDDQRIFGPLCDNQCACETYKGEKYRGMICHICGTKITRTDVRRRRFGHVQFPLPVPHPLGNRNTLLSVFPILPAAFHSRGRSHVTPLYDELIKAIEAATKRLPKADFDPLKTIVPVLQAVIEEILPSATYAQESSLPERDVLARGLALVPASSSTSERCDYCGYPLEGLGLDICPGCENRIR
jgi:hypothetical protein